MNDLKSIIVEINEKISKQGLKISFIKCEVMCKDNIILLNTINDDICKHQNIFSATELEFFQTIIREIIMSDDHRINNISLINLTNTLTTTLKKDLAEKNIETWTSLGYLVTKDGFSYLGARCIVEFTSYFQNHCKDYLNSCHLCSELVFSVSILISYNTKFVMLMLYIKMYNISIVHFIW